MNQKHFLFIIAIYCLTMLTCCGGTSNGDNTGNSDNGGDTVLAGLPDCSASNEFFTVKPIADEDFMGLVPLGNLNPSGHVFPTDHIYFYVKQQDAPNESLPATVNVVAPGTFKIISINSSEHLTDGFTDYTIYFSNCQQFKASFGHLQTLSQTILDQAGTLTDGTCSTYSTGGKDYRMCQKTVDIDVNAGDLLGTAGRAGATSQDSQNALDFMAFDYRTTPLAYANPSRNDSDRLYTVCPVDYFSADIKASLQSRFGNYNGTILRTVAPLCGEVMQDVSNTAQGKWYVKDTSSSSPEDPHLALVHDNVDPSVPDFSVGTSINNLSSSVYSFDPLTSGVIDRDFDDVTADGNIYCYSISAGNRIILELTTSSTLRIEYQSGESCSSTPYSFTDAYTDFER